MSRHNHHHSQGGGPSTTTTTTTNNGGGGGGPCGACKYLRRKCVAGCVFAPYFDSEQGTTHFAAVHKVFGASNASKLLLRIPSHKRLDAVFTLCYEALSRLRDPVYGCVSHIFTLHQQVLSMQAELAFIQARLSNLQRQPATFTLNSNHITTLQNCIIDDNNHISQPLSSWTSPSHVDSMPVFDSNSQSPVITPAPISATTATTDLVGFSDLTDHHQEGGMLIEDDDLQTLTREFVSKYLPGVKFKGEPK